MRITAHSIMRADQRASMAPEDVVALIKGNAVVRLGASGNYDYVLFWSYPRQKAKIAVLSHDQKNLISIWEVDFALPGGVMSPKVKHFRKARRLYQKYTFDRLVAEPTGNETASVRIEIRRDDSVEYVYDCGIILATIGNSHVQVVTSLKKELSLLSKIVCDHAHLFPGSYSYVVVVRCAITKARLSIHRIFHDEVLQVIEAAV